MLRRGSAKLPFGEWHEKNFSYLCRRKRLSRRGYADNQPCVVKVCRDSQGAVLRLGRYWWLFVGNKLSGWVQRRGLRLGQTFVELCPFHVKRYRFKSWYPLPLEWSPKTIKQSMKDARSPPRRSTRLLSLLSRSVCATDRRQGLGLSQRRPELTLKQGVRKQTHQLTDCVVPPAP